MYIIFIKVSRSYSRCCVSHLIVTHWSCPSSCAALRDDCSVRPCSTLCGVGPRQVAWVLMRSWIRGRAWPEGHGESSRITAGADARPKAAAAACLAEQWCAAVHDASWPGGLALFLPFLCIGWLLLLDVSDSMLLPTERFAGRTGLLLFWFLPVCLVHHWWVGRVGRCGLLT